MSYAMMIKENIRKYPELKIIDAHKLYKEKFNSISEQAFYKILSRMLKEGEIKRISKGIYCIPKNGRFGIVISGESNIIEYYLGSKRNQGIVIGYRMYNKYKLTTQVSKGVEIYSNILSQDKKKIQNVVIYKVNIRFDESTVRLIELLEVLQNYNKIEDLNKENLVNFIKTSIQYYDKKILEKVVNFIGYKKSTLDSLKNVLNYFEVENTIDEYLSGVSKYNSLRMEDLYEFIS